MTSNIEKVFAAIDALNDQDPQKKLVGEKEVAACLLYGQRMTTMLTQISPTASEELQIAVRAQHLGRWLLPRTDFPTGRAGYLKWRTTQAVEHAKKACAFMQELGYSTASQERVTHLLRKKDLKNDSETQLLEDCACLVFLTYEMDDFIASYPREKVISILQKTWGKMSNEAQQTALEIDLSAPALELVQAALKGE